MTFTVTLLIISHLKCLIVLKYYIRLLSIHLNQLVSVCFFLVLNSHRKTVTLILDFNAVCAEKATKGFRFLQIAERCIEKIMFWCKYCNNVHLPWSYRSNSSFAIEDKWLVMCLIMIGYDLNGSKTAEMCWLHLETDSMMLCYMWKCTYIDHV